MKNKTILMCLWAILLTATLMISLFPQNSEALTLELKLDGVISGYAPQGTAPWLVATFEDVAGGVQLTLSSAGLTGGEFLQGNIDTNNINASQFGWGFNINPSLEWAIASLVFDPVRGTLAAGIQAAADAFKGAGDGFFDILFAWDNKNRFGAGAEAVYLISGIGGLSAMDFNYLSEGGVVGYPSAAKIQGIIIPGVIEGGSGWIATPEPATMVLLGCGLIGIGIFVRRKFRS